MKKLMMAVAGVIIGTAVLSAQPPQGAVPVDSVAPEVLADPGDAEAASAVDLKWETSRASHFFISD